MIVYESYTGNCQTFANNISSNTISIKDATPTSPFILVLPTLGLGKVSKAAFTFLKNHHQQCEGIMVSGDPRFKKWYCGAAKFVTKKYPKIKVLHTFTRNGTEEDIKLAKQIVSDFQSK